MKLHLAELLLDRGEALIELFDLIAGAFRRFDLRAGVLSRRNGRFARCWPLLKIAGSYCNWRFCIGWRIDVSFRARCARRFAVSPNTKQTV